MVCERVMAMCFAVNLLLLTGTDRLFSCQTSIGNLTLGAAVSAVYGGACMLQGAAFFAGWFLRAAVLVLIGFLTYGCSMRSVKRVAVYAVISLLLDSISSGGLVGALFSAWLILLISYAAGCTKLLPLEIRRNEKQVKLTAFQDTGNLLRDPVSGCPVLVVCLEVSKELTGLSREQLASPMQTMTDMVMPGLRLVPFQTVGQEHGLLLAMRCQEVILAGRARDVLVGLSPASFGGGMYQALTGGI